MTDATELQPFQRIVTDVRDQIRQGRLQPGDKLPSIKGLCAQYDVAAGTVQRALTELRSLGLVYSHQGRGSFIRGTATEDDPVTTAIRNMQAQIAELTERLEKVERAHHV